MPKTPANETVDEAIAALDTVRREWLRRPGVTAVDAPEDKGPELHARSWVQALHAVEARYRRQAAEANLGIEPRAITGDDVIDQHTAELVAADLGDIEGEQPSRAVGRQPLRHREAHP